MCPSRTPKSLAGSASCPNVEMQLRMRPRKAADTIIDESFSFIKFSPPSVCSTVAAVYLLRLRTIALRGPPLQCFLSSARRPTRVSCLLHEGISLNRGSSDEWRNTYLLRGKGRRADFLSCKRRGCVLLPSE